jgi:hypothetical protein
MDWVDLAQDMDQWRALVEKIMNLSVLGWLSDWRFLKKEVSDSVPCDTNTGRTVRSHHPNVINTTWRRI